MWIPTKGQDNPWGFSSQNTWFLFKNHTDSPHKRPGHTESIHDIMCQ